jgi:PAS domain S-box-containing protein
MELETRLARALEAGADPTDAQFRLLVETVSDYAIYLLDTSGRVVSWNAGAERIKGYAAREIMGRHFSLFYPSEEREAGTPERMLEQARREGRITAQGWRVRKDGTRFLANVVITALYDDHGELRGFGKVTRDITDRKRAERELAAATAEVERQRLRRMHALEIHDNVIQSLVLAKYAFESGDADRAEEMLTDALNQARRIVGDMQDQTGPTKGGDFRRRSGALARGER